MGSSWSACEAPIMGGLAAAILPVANKWQLEPAFVYFNKTWPGESSIDAFPCKKPRSIECSQCRHPASTLKWLLNDSRLIYPGPSMTSQSVPSIFACLIDEYELLWKRIHLSELVIILSNLLRNTFSSSFYYERGPYRMNYRNLKQIPQSFLSISKFSIKIPNKFPVISTEPNPKTDLPKPQARPPIPK